MTYKELGADYLDNKTKKRRESYLKHELEKLGYQVDLTVVCKTEIADSIKEISFADAAATFAKEGTPKVAKTAKATKTVKTDSVVRATG